MLLHGVRSQNYHTSYAPVCFRGNEHIHHSKTKTSWGWIERTRYRQIPPELLDLSERINKDLNKSWDKFSLDKQLRPKVLFKIPDNFPYRGLTPVRSINKRLNDAQKRIDKTLHHEKEQPISKFKKFFSNTVNKIAKKLNLDLPKDYINKLKDPDKFKRDEALRAYMFDDTKTACALFNLPHNVIMIDMGRLSALQKEINKDKELKKLYPDFEETFKQMLAADVVLKYQSLSGINPSIFNSKLLVNSFKSGARFFLPPIPGLADSVVVFGVTLKEYITGIARYMDAVKLVNSRDFDFVHSVETMKTLPLFGKQVVETIQQNIQTYKNELPHHLYKQYSKLIRDINSLPEDIKQLIGPLPGLTDIIKNNNQKEIIPQAF